MKTETDSSSPSKNETEWFLYVIRCKDDSLYTGITTNVERRFAEHQSGKGAKYLRGKVPLVLVHQQKIGTRSEALKAELALKKLSKVDKEEFIRTAVLTF